MPATYSFNKNHNCGINQTPGKTLVHCSGNASGEKSVKSLVKITSSDS